MWMMDIFLTEFLGGSFIKKIATSQISQCLERSKYYLDLTYQDANIGKISNWWELTDAGVCKPVATVHIHGHCFHISGNT